MSAAGGFLPFTAVVGQEEAKLALLLAAVEPAIGGVLMRGEKGSAKSTLARGLAALLPGDRPFVELPVGATEDRVVGTLDLGAALTAGEKRFDPGLLHAADGGVLYVDEINLLPDHLVDVLLDVAASGVNRIEREGVSHSHPSRFLLIGSMNPEEGDLRPQLLDRFGLAVEVRGPGREGERVQALRRRLEYDRDPGAVTAAYAGEEAALLERLAGCRPAALPDVVLEAVAALCARAGAEGLRADLTICRAAGALAGWEGRREATMDDVRRVAPLALAHRARRDPFDQVGPWDAPGDAGPPAGGADGGAAGGDDGTGPAADGDAGSGSPPGDRGSAPQGGPGSASEDGPGSAPQGGGGSAPGGGPGSTPQGVSGGREMNLVDLRRPPGDRPAIAAGASGRRAPGAGGRGRVIGNRAPDGPVTSVAVGATVRRAVARRGAEDEPRIAALVEHGDIRQAVHEDRRSHLIVIAVDASGSMGARRRMEAAKGVVMSLLRDAYVKRDLVSLVTFSGENADVLLRPTASVEVARARLNDLPSGGWTPLAAGLRAALRVAQSRPGAGHEPLIVIITDGRATGPDGGAGPLGEAHAAAAEVRRAGVRTLVIDVEGQPGALGLGLGRELARRLGGEHQAVEDLDPEVIEAGVRRLAGFAAGT